MLVLGEVQLEAWGRRDWFFGAGTAQVVADFCASKWPDMGR